MFSTFSNGEFGLRPGDSRGWPSLFLLPANVVYCNAECCELQCSAFAIQQYVPKARAAESGFFSTYPLTNEKLQQAMSMSGHP